jgi:hypothetical protein
MSPWTNNLWAIASAAGGGCRILPPQPTMRTDLSFGAEKSETIVVSDFFYANFCC